MAKYNNKQEKVVKQTTTHQGGTGYTQRAEHELVGILATGMTNNFYEKETEREIRFKTIINEISKKDPKFVAQALIYARSVMGQRSVTHLGAVYLAPYLSGNPLGTKFFSKRERNANAGGIIYRLDDMYEILAAYQNKNPNSKSIPNAIKRGFKIAIENTDKHILAKYQAKTRNISLVDIVNLVRPKETAIQGFVELPKAEYLKVVEKSRSKKLSVKDFEDCGETVKIPTLRALVYGLLKQTDTVEDKNSATGQKVAAAVKAGTVTAAQGAIMLNEEKASNFEALIDSKKIGYLALLRNLRNIINTKDAKVINKACNLLVEKDFIHKSLVWPHQIDLAIEVLLLEFSGKVLNQVIKALNTAYENSIPNLNELLPEGRTAVVFDTSGSMSRGWSKVQVNNGNKSCIINSLPIEKAALIASTFAKGTCADLYQFALETKEIKYNPTDSIHSIKTECMRHSGEVGHGTAMNTIFNKFASLNRTYDRVLIITDEQNGEYQLESSMKMYSRQFGTPYVYFINLCGYTTTATKTTNTISRIYGYSADIYDKIKELELDKEAVIKAIREINI